MSHLIYPKPASLQSNIAALPCVKFAQEPCVLAGEQHFVVAYSQMSNSTPFQTPRQRARELAFQFLFRFDQDKESQATPIQIESEFTQHAEHFKTQPESLEFALRLVKATLAQLQNVDQVILKHAENWRLERLGTVEKSLLRIGTAELLYFKDVPASVTLNEIVELAKNFGEAETPAFINGILDPISREPEAQNGKIASDS